MKQTKILTIANRKGGAGKSTCAAHIAIEAVNSGLKTILIDLDPQKTLEAWWKQREVENPYLTDIDPHKIEETIAKFNDLDFDLCIIDTPGDTSINSAAGMKVANLVLIPTKSTAPDLQAIGRTIASIKNLNKEYVFVLTQTVQRAKLTLQAAAVLSEFGVVVPTSIANRVSYANAMGAGTSAADEDKLAKEEISLLWDFLNTKLFVQEGKHDKEKIRINV